MIEDVVQKRDFLGRGWTFPFQFTRRTGGVFKGTTVAKSGDVPHITQSILQILQTAIGSRVIRRDFGSEIYGVVFEPNDPSLDAQFDFMIRKAIETWEPRVIVGSIILNRSEYKDGRLYIEINIRIIKTNTATNIVFDYFLTEEERKTWANYGGGNK